MSILHKLINCWKYHSLEGFLGRELVRTTYKEVWIKIPSGQSIYAHVHSPAIPGRYPGVILVPGGNSPGTVYDRGAGLRAKDLASCGFTVLHYDPSGRGRTGGKEDYWGPVHQEELSYIVDYFSKLSEVDGSNIGIFSFSIGITVASGALARFPMPHVKYLFDWEGPSNRFNITLNDTHKPLKNFPTSNDAFWKDRETVRYIGDIPCGYFRYQAEVDHVQGTNKSHAVELLNRATKGKALWTRCNDNPVNTVFDENRLDSYVWVPHHLNHKGQILKYFLMCNVL